MAESKPRKPGTFTKGDQRINRKGRPKTFDALRRLALDVAHRQAMNPEGEPVLIEDMPVSVIESVMIAWAHSGEPALQKAFVEIAYGKVPNVTELTGKDGGPVKAEMTRKPDLAKLAPDELRALRDLIVKAGPDDSAGAG